MRGIGGLLIISGLIACFTGVGIIIGIILMFIGASMLEKADEEEY